MAECRHRALCPLPQCTVPMTAHFNLLLVAPTCLPDIHRAAHRKHSGAVIKTAPHVTFHSAMGCILCTRGSGWWLDLPREAKPLKHKVGTRETRQQTISNVILGAGQALTAWSAPGDSPQSPSVSYRPSTLIHASIASASASASASAQSTIS